MRTTLIAATVVAIGLATFALTDLQAQQQQPAAPRGGSPAVHHGVAVIDVTYVLDNYSRLKANIEGFKRDVQTAGDGFKKEQEAMVKQAEQLKALKPGSDQFKDLEEKLAKKQSDFKINTSLREREFAERESKLYLSGYKELTAAVKVYCDRSNISLVLRFNGAPVDQNNRDAVRADVLKMVMYNHRDIDITDQILAEMNRGAATAQQPAPGRAPAQPQRR